MSPSETSKPAPPPKPQTILFHNRITGEREEEQVFGERWLRWVYENPVGRMALWPVARHAWFSRWYGWRMSRPASRRWIRPFVEQYGLNAEEFAKPLESYQSFNDFFTRALKPQARRISGGDSTAVFPADGRHLGFPNYHEADGVFVKGKKFSLAELLDSRDMAERFNRGTVVISRLCPTDYHRFHFPVAGVPGSAVTIPGPLYSVNPIALRRNISILASNRRMITELATDTFGLVLLLEVGATCVGSIHQSYTPGDAVAKGAEKGWFAFGGSTVITLFEPGRLQLAPDLIAHSRQNRELYTQMGDHLGEATK